MKLLIKVLMIVLILFMSNLFLFKTMDGDASLEVSNPIPSFISDLFDFKKWGKDITKASGKAMGDEHAGQTKIFRWTSADGTKQFSNVPPTGVEFETVWVDPDANIIEALKPPPRKKAASSSNSTTSQASIPSLLTVSPDKVKKLVEDARKVQEMSDERAKTLEKL